MDREKLIAALAGTWPVRAAKSGLAAIQLPGEVYQGNVSMYGEDGRTNPEVIGRSADLAGTAMLGGPLGGVPKGAIGSSMSHLDALNLRLSNERNRLAKARTATEREQRQVWVAQVEKEIAREEEFLGKQAGPLPEISDDDLLKELLGK
jgi:hypothetical protein